jgi:hypothetical protein
MDLEALRLLIQEKLQDGRLPHERISRMQSCPADGEKCDACEKRIAMAQFVVTGITLGGRGSIQLHVQCFQLWDHERCAAEVAASLRAFTPLDTKCCWPRPVAVPPTPPSGPHATGSVPSRGISPHDLLDWPDLRRAQHR